MNALPVSVADRLVQSLGWTLVHFLWQGAAIAGLFALLRAATRRHAAQSRYLAGCIALTLMAVSPLLTFAVMHVPVDRQSVTAVIGLKQTYNSPKITSAALRSGPENRLTFSAAVDFVLRACVSLWFVGMTALATRLLGGWWRVQRLRTRKVELLGEPWLGTLEGLRKRMGISRPVLLLKSALIEVPTVIGWLRPVILVPASSLTGLTPQQLESIFAHELAHIQRHDYLVNFLQRVLETVLFYHPAVWWVSNEVREERECCCDDLAVETCGDRVGYARALTILEQLRPGPIPFALGATDGSLLDRVRRLFGISSDKPSNLRRRIWFFPLLVLGVCLTAILGNSAFRPSLYKATTRLVVNRIAEGDTGPSRADLKPAFDPYFLQVELERIRSRLVLHTVIKNLRLDKRLAEQTGSASPLSEANTYSLLMKRLQVRQTRNSSMIELAVYDQDRFQAAEIANAIADVYVEHQRQQKHFMTSSVIKALETSRAERDYIVEAAQEKVVKLRTELQVSDADENESGSSRSEERRNALERESVAIELKIGHSEGLLNQLESLPRDKRADSMPASLNPDRLLEDLLGQLNLSERQLASLKVDHGQEHPAVLSLQRTLKQTREQIDRRVEGIERGLRSEVARHRVQWEVIKRKIKEEAEIGSQTTSKMQPYFEAKRALETAQRVRDALTRRILQEGIDSEALRNKVKVEIVDRAEPPLSPSRWGIGF